MGTTTGLKPHPALVDWLRRNDIDHEVHEHDLAFTARATARAEGVDPHLFAKVVGARTDDGRDVLLIVEAVDRVDLAKARRAVGADDLRLLSEDELTAVAPDCEVGAIPAVGALFGLATYVDHAVRDDPWIAFNAGSHQVAVRVDREGWEKAVGAQYADIAAEVDGRPAWVRS